ncbi:hypothetical protein Pla175_15220 [Pirellulimonas nuda]|uniref:Uncharacterized protein n=1 Tax=Pirellulimonas nuda TaxID=2528009 RepID=A0A518D9J5_9BACT|nr:hypothetical protein [Pirellulimonas nuda]QDU88151.1 hypothetical protein Pla175_15220 [Pirellulimonas nuda]
MSTPTAPVPAIDYPDAQWLQPVTLPAESFMAFSGLLAESLAELESRYPSVPSGRFSVGPPPRSGSESR